MPRFLGICLGDPSGIGPEVALKAIAAEPPGPEFGYEIIGCPALVEQTQAKLGTGVRLSPAEHAPRAGEVTVHDRFGAALPANLAPGAPEAARAAVAWLQAGAEACLRGHLAGMVTAPVNKHAIVEAGIPFIGQTEFLSALAGTRRTAMMLLGTDPQGRWLRVALATTHLALRKVPDALTQPRVLQAIELAHEACASLRLTRRRIAVCGLNPHAGEDGEFGDEEPRIIAPAIAAGQAAGIDAVGPLSGDTVFHLAIRGDFDAVVAMYHDQGLAPLKLAAFDTGVNWTLGLPFIRTSPDHGTAYDLAGKGRANPSSMIAALRLGKQLATNESS
jgi:4-hydroxythreonine-4-phosphate dehydrogenase